MKFEYSDDNKRYHTLNYHLKNKFGGKIYKAVIDAGFSCPNIDGAVSRGGCAFCLGGSGAFTHSGSITEQLANEQKRLTAKYGKPQKMIAYFQAHTNTYAPVEVLNAKYGEALSFPDVCGLAIATRPDCIDDKTSACLQKLSEQTYLTVELGLQTVFDKTANGFNRGYGFACFEDTFLKLKNAGIRVCVHMIDGLYGETPEMMLDTAKKVGLMYPDAVKISLLHILRGTEYEKLYHSGKYTPLSKDDYIDIVCSQIALLPPECVIERVTGDGAKADLIAPAWSINKISVLGGIDKKMAERNIYQGSEFTNY
ncbi:MAG: TIGR01212 family radical SAM protein [Clostridia bacterium]|nr:TIGR01212 family radical SAM protein [Clostridia bacterium]